MKAHQHRLKSSLNDIIHCYVVVWDSCQCRELGHKGRCCGEDGFAGYG